MAGLALSSPAFAPGGAIPRRHSCEGADRSPELRWTGVPPGCGSLALIVEDPDAPGGTFTHRLAWGLAPADGGLAEGERAPREGRTGFGTIGYRGPCPPRGHGPHRYVFRLLALDGPLELPEGAGPAEVAATVAGRIVASAELVGRYERR